MDRNDKKEFLANFSKTYNNMIATNDGAYKNIFGSTLYKRRYHRKYTLEEIENIIDNGSLAERITLSRTFFQKGGFYQRILLHYATLLKYTGLLIPNPSFGHSLSESYIVTGFIHKYGNCCFARWLLLWNNSNSQ